MNIGVIGLGRMGNAVAFRLKQAKFHVYGFDINKTAQEEAAALGVTIIDNLEQMPTHAQAIWLMLPAGSLIDDTLKILLPGMSTSTIIVDGGNSHYTDSVRRAAWLQQHGIAYLDVGTSGGLLGREVGFSLMIGGDRQAYQQLESAFKALAWPNGYAHVGPSGAGHYVKMVHNGIEYALLQAYAEGFDLLKHGHYQLDMEQVARVWCNGSVIRSWILELAHTIFQQDQNFTDISGKIGGGSTGAWTVEEAHKRNIPVKLIEDALEIRYQSQQTGGNYATKLVALLRNQFGGHEVKNLDVE